MKRLEIVLVALLLSSASTENSKPHIIVIIADDLGWNDVGFHGSNEIPTPNIDALAYNGVILNNHYTQSLCTPSRSAFLTGKYPIHTGMQHLVLLESEPRGLDLKEKLLPQYLKEHGYSTYAIGKWHLGFYKKEYTPTYRGFDYHYGYWQGLKDYYTHMNHETFNDAVGYDLRRNMDVDWDSVGKYSTELFTTEAQNIIMQHNASEPMFMYFSHLAVHTGNADNPMQAPEEEIAKFSYIDDLNRRIYAAMVSLLDKSVGQVIAALKKKQMLENSVVLFMSDNGASTVSTHHANHGSNFPLRGLKHSPWEGGSRCVAAIWSPLIKKTQRVSNHLMDITDWLPTFYSLIGLNSTDLKNIDGVDMWSAISEGSESTRTEIVYNIDEIENYSAIRRNEWKYINGTTLKGEFDLWYGSSNNEKKDQQYDEDLVLSSEAGSTFAEFITSMQTNDQHPLLNHNTITSLRASATINCSNSNVDDLPEEYICKPLESPCLFNIQNDPCEIMNRAKQNQDVLADLEKVLLKMKESVVKPLVVKMDPKANPKYWNNTWVPWQDTITTSSSEIHAI